MTHRRHLEGAHVAQDTQALADRPLADVQTRADIRKTQWFRTRETNPVDGRDGLRHAEDVRGIGKKRNHGDLERDELRVAAVGSKQSSRRAFAPAIRNRERPRTSVPASNGPASSRAVELSFATSHALKIIPMQSSIQNELNWFEKV